MIVSRKCFVIHG